MQDYYSCTPNYLNAWSNIGFLVHDANASYTISLKNWWITHREVRSQVDSDSAIELPVLMLHL